jgi:EmrB/QacA subfamily drug resistance transporter
MAIGQPTGTAAVPVLPGGPPGARVRQAEVLLLTTLGTVMVAVDSTIVILALPTMARELASPLDTVIWTILVYLLITAALTTQAGRLGDVVGRSRIYNLGFAVFTVGSALSGFAPTAAILIGARAVQAVGGAIMFANAGALITQVFPAERRGRAFGYLVLGWSVGAILGILLGGVITTTLGWRYNFFINLPIGAVAVTLGVRTLPPSERQPAQFDVPGFALFSASLGALSYGAIEYAANGPSLGSLAFVLAGAALLPAFIVVELRSAHPMLELRELTQRLLGFSLLASLLQALGYLSVVFLLTMYLQGIRGLSPLDASILLVPGYLVGAVVGPFMGRQVDRIGPRLLATFGLLLMLAAVLAYAQLTPGSWLGWVPAISLVSGIGTGSFFPANTTAIMSQAPPRRLGAISGLRGALTNIGTLLSFVVTLSIASASVSRAVAYEVFLGTTDLTGGVAGQFLGGIRAALYGSAAILGVAAALSWSRGRPTPPAPARPMESPAS